MVAVRLACGHEVTVTHERGDRLVQCQAERCGRTAVVHAQHTSTVTYVVRADTRPGAPASFDSGLTEVTHG